MAPRPKRSNGPLFFLVINDGDGQVTKLGRRDLAVFCLKQVVAGLELGVESGDIRDLDGVRCGRYELRHSTFFGEFEAQ